MNLEFCVWVCSSGKQFLCQGELALDCGFVQRRLPVFVGSVHERAVVAQRLHRLRMAAENRVMQRRFPVRVPPVHVRASDNQLPHRLLMASPSRIVDWQPVAVLRVEYGGCAAAGGVGV